MNPGDIFGAVFGIAMLAATVAGILVMCFGVPTSIASWPMKVRRLLDALRKKA